MARLLSRKGTILKLGALSLLLFLLSVFAINFTVGNAAHGRIYTETSKLKPHDVAVVLGAQVKPDGTPSDMLTDRLETALTLYRSGKVKKLLVSGDHSRPEYDEVNTMRNYLLKGGVADKDLFTDYAGFDTYDSLYRARDIFGISSAVVISQRFHLPRALYIAKKLGINAVGFSADLHNYGEQGKRSSIREIPARVKAFKDVLRGVKPHFLGKKIPITGDGRSSWDSN